MRKLVPTLVAAFVGIAASSQKHSTHTTVYLSKVEKSFHAPIFERFAGSDFSIVVSRNAVRGHQNVAVTLQEFESLAFVELYDHGNARLTGEVARFDGLAFIKTAKQFSPAHLDIGDERNHVRVIDTTRPETDNFSAPAPSLTPDTVTDLAPNIVPLVPKETLLLWLQELSGEKAFDTPEGSKKISDRGSDEGRKLARLWLAQKYKALGFTVSEHNYGKGTNFIADRAGKDIPSITLALTMTEQEPSQPSPLRLH